MTCKAENEGWHDNDNHARNSCHSTLASVIVKLSNILHPVSLYRRICQDGGTLFFSLHPPFSFFLYCTNTLVRKSVICERFLLFFPLIFLRLAKFGSADYRYYLGRPLLRRLGCYGDNTRLNGSPGDHENCDTNRGRPGLENWGQGKRDSEKELSFMRPFDILDFWEHFCVVIEWFRDRFLTPPQNYRIIASVL